MQKSIVPVVPDSTPPLPPPAASASPLPSMSESNTVESLKSPLQKVKISASPKTPKRNTEGISGTSYAKVPSPKRADVNTKQPNRNSNILVAVLSLLEELDHSGLEAVQLRTVQLLRDNATESNV